MEKINIATHELEFGDGGVGVRIKDLATNTMLDVTNLEAFIEQLPRQQQIELASMKAPFGEGDEVTKSNIKKMAIIKMQDMRVLTNLTMLEEDNNFRELILKRIRLLRAMRRKIRKPYCCRYPEKALEEINWAIDRDSNAAYVQQICYKYDPFAPTDSTKPGKPSLSQVLDYMAYYKEQKRMLQAERGAMIEVGEDGLQTLIDKAMSGEDPSRADYMKAHMSLIAKLKFQMEILQRENVGVVDTDRIDQIKKIIDSSDNILEKLTKLSGKVASDGGTSITNNIYNYSPEEIFAEVMGVVTRAVRKMFPQQSTEIERAITEEFNSFIAPQRKMIDVTPKDEKGSGKRSQSKKEDKHVESE